MNNLESFPMLEYTLNKLLDKSEKDWGYLQIKKKDDIHAVQFSSGDDYTIGSFKDETNNSYQLHWYAKPRPSVLRVYVLYLLGSNEDTIRVFHDEASDLCQLHWYASPRPSVFVETKLNKTFDRQTRKYPKQKTYEIRHQLHSNSLISSINKMFGDLVKAKINENVSKEKVGDEKLPIITLIAQ